MVNHDSAESMRVRINAACVILPSAFKKHSAMVIRNYKVKPALVGIVRSTRKGMSDAIIINNYVNFDSFTRDQLWRCVIERSNELSLNACRVETTQSEDVD
jgi:hypothetical protein